METSSCNGFVPSLYDVSDTSFSEADDSVKKHRDSLSSDWVTQLSAQISRRRSHMFTTTIRSQYDNGDQDENVERNGLRNRFSQFRHNLATQNFSDQEKKALNAFSSLNYSPTHSVSFIKWFGEQKDRFYSRLNLDRWFLLTVIGIVVGLLAALLKQSITALSGVQWKQTKLYLKDGQIAGGFFFALGVNCAYIVVSGFLVTFVHPPAAGGGTPEIIAFLNGIMVHGTLTFKNLIVKFISNVFAVSSGLPAAIQAPIITFGAIVGAGVGQFQSKTLGVKPNIFTRFRNAADRREFTTAGVAAGVAAGFNSPIGGLLFAMEDLSSFWNKGLSWSTFFCCVIATIVAELFNTAFSGFKYRTQFGTLTENLIHSIQMHILTLVPAIVLGFCGGVLGALFTRTNTFICSNRKILLSKIKKVAVARIIRILETLLVVTLMTIYSVFLPYGFQCVKVSNETNISPLNTSLLQAINADLLNCPVVPANSSTVYYNPMSTLIQGGGTAYLNKLWSRSTYFAFDYNVCLSAFAVYYVLTIWTAGTAIAGGIFVPLLVNGSLFGRALGVGMTYIWISVTGTPYPTNQWLWIDPGVTAAIGAAGLLGGVNRLAVASTVIVTEMVGDINLVIPNLIAIFIAKMVAEQFSKPLYKYHLDAKVLPYLEQEPKVVVAGKQLNLELCRASDVMSTPVYTIRSLESVGKLARMLTEHNHSGFPVVKQDVNSDSSDEIVYGFLTRIELYVILCSEDVYRQETQGSIVTPNIDYEELSVDYIADKRAAEERIRTFRKFQVYNSIYVDLEPFINISTPKIDKDYSLYRTYMIFRTLGLRHLVVIDGHNRAVGIITRKDLLQFRMEERLEALLAGSISLENKGAQEQPSPSPSRGSEQSSDVVINNAASDRTTTVTTTTTTTAPDAAQKTSETTTATTTIEKQTTPSTAAVNSAFVADDEVTPNTATVTHSPPPPEVVVVNNNNNNNRSTRVDEFHDYGSVGIERPSQSRRRASDIGVVLSRVIEGKRGIAREEAIREEQFASKSIDFLIRRPLRPNGEVKIGQDLIVGDRQTPH